MRRFFLHPITLFFCYILLFFGSHLGYNFFTYNIHTVIPNTVYRSAQLNHQTLTKYTQKFRWKTIINLRGPWTNDHWYQVEKAFTQQHHLNYVVIRFSAYQLPPKADLQKLVATLQTAPKPLVFHCEGGADRTGLAAAISVILFSKHPTLSAVKRQDSWLYNAISRKTVGYQVLQNYFDWLAENHVAFSKGSFLTWVNLPGPMKPHYGWFAVA